MSRTSNHVRQLSRSSLQTPSQFMLTTPSIRCFCKHFPLLSGHSRWSKIKHDKAKVDVARSKTRTNYATEITLASKLHGPDPKSNPRLHDAIARAKKASMPKSNIETAIARGQGLSVTGASLESILEEAVFPPGVAVLVDILTDNKQQAKIDIRKVFKLHGANLSNTAYLFDKKGRLTLQSKEGVNEEMLLEEAVNVDALDVQEAESGWIISTEIKDLTLVADHLKTTLDMDIEESEIVWSAKELLDIDEKAASLLDEMIDKLKEIPSVKEIYTNVR